MSIAFLQQCSVRSLVAEDRPAARPGAAGAGWNKRIDWRDRVNWVNWVTGRDRTDGRDGWDRADRTDRTNGVNGTDPLHPG